MQTETPVIGSNTAPPPIVFTDAAAAKVAELGVVPGDANQDGTFDSADLILVFKAGEYEDGIPGNSTWAEGDWNCDGDFTTSDLVAALQDGGYLQGPL